MSESQLQRAVISLAQMRGWRVAHFRNAQMPNGRWLTPVQADGKGFPDLVMVRGGRIVVAELKAKWRKASPEQDVWLEDFKKAGAEAYLWGPLQWDEGLVAEVLK